MNDFNLQIQVEKCIQLYSDISGANILKISEQVQLGKFSFSGTLSQYEFTTRIRKTLGIIKKEYVAIEQDFMSWIYPNGFSVSIAICGNCMRKLYHKYSVGKLPLWLFQANKTKSWV